MANDQVITFDQISNREYEIRFKKNVYQMFYSNFFDFYVHCSIVGKFFIKN